MMTNSDFPYYCGYNNPVLSLLRCVLDSLDSVLFNAVLHVSVSLQFNLLRLFKVGPLPHHTDLYGTIQTRSSGLAVSVLRIAT